MATSYELGETARLTASITDSGGSAADPTTTTITVKAPDRSTVVDAQSMTKDSVGEYHYDYTIPATTGQVGTYTWKVTATGAGSRVTIKTGEFDVVKSV